MFTPKTHETDAPESLVTSCAEEKVIFVLAQVQLQLYSVIMHRHNFQTITLHQIRILSFTTLKEGHIEGTE